MKSIGELRDLGNTMICQKCHKTADELRALHKYVIVDGYAQCSDCHSDLEYASVVLRERYSRRGRGISLENWLRFPDELKDRTIMLGSSLPNIKILVR